MPHPYVISAKITGGKIELGVLVDGFEPAEYVEISGQATQTNGALANFYDIKDVPDKPNVPADPSIPNDTDHYCVYVSAPLLPNSPKKFSKDLDVTTVFRVAKLWLTVLGEHGEVLGDQPPPQEAGDGTMWDIVKAVSAVGDDGW
jgi:hypothetical protein